MAKKRRRLPRYKIVYKHPWDKEPDEFIVYTSNIEKKFTELQRENPKVDFISYEFLEYKN